MNEWSTRLLGGAQERRVEPVKMVSTLIGRQVRPRPGKWVCNTVDPTKFGCGNKKHTRSDEAATGIGRTLSTLLSVFLGVAWPYLTPRCSTRRSPLLLLHTG